MRELTHRSAGDGVAAATGPGGQNSSTRSDDVDNAAVVGEGRATVGRVSGTDSTGLGGRGRGVVGSVGVVVTGGNGKEDVVVDHGSSSLVEGSREATAKRHVGKDTVGAVTAAGVRSNEVHTGDDARVRTRTSVVEDLDAVELGALSDTVAAAANGTGAVSTVAIAIGVGATGVVGNHARAATELLSIC